MPCHDLKQAALNCSCGSGHAEQGVAQSTRISGDGGAVLRATLRVIQPLNGSTDDCFLANDGGASWEAVHPGVEHVFTTHACDLRWKAVLQGNGIHTPAIDQVTIDWPAESPTPTVTRTPTTTATPTATKGPHAIDLPIIMHN